MRREGIVKCTVLPPRYVYHPVLQYRCNKRVLFCLCRTCSETGDGSVECTHESETARALTGKWVVDGVRAAVERGYRVLEIQEFYEYEVTR